MSHDSVDLGQMVHDAMVYEIIEQANKTGIPYCELSKNAVLIINGREVKSTSSGLLMLNIEANPNIPANEIHAVINGKTVPLITNLDTQEKVVMDQNLNDDWASHCTNEAIKMSITPDYEMDAELWQSHDGDRFIIYHYLANKIETGVFGDGKPIQVSLDDFHYIFKDWIKVGDL